MNWAFAFPLSKRWLADPESRDKYRQHIDSWLTGIFTVFNLLALIIIFIIWGGNDSLIFSYQNVFIAVLLLLSVVLVLTLLVPPILILKGPAKNG